MKVIAIDFDGCLCSNAYPEVGEPNWAVIEKAKAEKADGAGLVLWTCRCGTIGRAQRAVHNIKYRKKMSEGRL